MFNTFIVEDVDADDHEFLRDRIARGPEFSAEFAIHLEDHL